MSYGGFGRPEDPTETERWERLKVASAPADPGEGHRTGTGGPDAPGAPEGLDAAIEAAAEAMREDIARRIEVLEDYEAAEIAREVGRGQ